jgi:hypothetical protein
MSQFGRHVFLIVFSIAKPLFLGQLLPYERENAVKKIGIVYTRLDEVWA